MKARTLMLSAAVIILLAAVALARSQSSGTPAPAWAGKSVVLARVDGRSMAPACPTLEQIRPYAQSRKWSRAALGCRFMLAGNFTHAQVLEDAPGFVRVRYTLTAGTPPWFLPREDTFWTPRDRYRLAP
jgi:hypothetical protein